MPRGLLLGELQPARVCIRFPSRRKSYHSENEIWSAFSNRIWTFFQVHGWHLLTSKVSWFQPRTWNEHALQATRWNIFFFFLNSAHLEYLPCVAPEQWWPQAMKRQLETSFEHDAGSANTLYPGKCLNLENSHWAVRHKCYIVATLLISWPLIFLIICSSHEICWSQNFHYTCSTFLLFSIIFMCFCVGK